MAKKGSTRWEVDKEGAVGVVATNKVNEGEESEGVVELDGVVVRGGGRGRRLWRGGRRKEEGVGGGKLGAGNDGE